MKTLQELKKTGFRIRVKGESEETKEQIQERLFALGWWWSYSGKSVRNVTNNYINCYENGSMFMGVDVNDGLPELTIAELFELQPEPTKTLCDMKTIELSLDKARQMYGQNETMDAFLLENFSKEELEEKHLPKSWEELREVKGYVNGNQSYIYNYKGKTSRANRNVFHTHKQAESSLAMAQLSQLMAVYNDGWKPDWNDKSNKYVIRRSSDNIEIANYAYLYMFLVFKTSELRDEFLNNFRPLIEQYFML